MKSFVIAIIFFTVCFGHSQVEKPEYGKLIEQFQEAYKKQEFRGMKRSTDALIKHYRDDYAGYALGAVFFMCRGQNNRAEPYLNTMLQLNPTVAGSNGIAAIYSYIMGRYDEAELYLQYAYQLMNYKEYKDELFEDIDIISVMAYRNDLLNMKSLINQVEQQGFKDIDRALKYRQQITDLTAGKKVSGFEQTIAEYNNMRPYNPVIEPLGTYAKAMNAYMVYENSKAKELFSKFITDTESFQKYSLRYYRASAYYLMATMAYSEYNNKVALVNAKRGLEEAKKLSNPIELEATLMYLKMSYEQQLGLNEDMMQTSSDLLVLANTIDSDLYKAQAHNTIGNYYLNSPYPNERSQAASNIFDAISYAEKGGYTELASSIKGNYVLVLWQAGRKNEAIAISNELFNDAYTKGKYSTAEVTANNMGFMYYMENEYSNAATFFQKAIDMTEDVRSALKPKERLALMNGHSSSYSGLVMSLQKLGDSKRLFEVQEMNRSRYLRDRLLPNSKAATLAEAQAMLKPGEVLLYYSLTAPGEIIINAITQNSSKIYYSYLLDEWIRLKKSYTDRQKQIPSAFNQFMSDYANDMADGYMIRYADKSQNLNSKDFKVITEWTRQLLEDSSSDLTGVRNDFLKVWYQATLAPIQELKSASNVIIGASNELNFLPFEAFMDGTGNYFIKNHSVRYIPSVSIWKLLQNRNYAGNRKPALCMGGAIYQPSGNVKGTVRGIDDFYGITESMELKMSKGDYNFSNELGQLGMGGANYLPGTLREVQFVGQLSPDIKVLTGMEMKESALKQMNKTGELKQYEALLISTHGFAYDIIPDLSGVMMSQPDNGDGNEDMFLLAPEIAQLDLNADIAILSACSTALGSIAGGEGVNGLNSAFLVAGANNTLLSLWPVNDSSTALTMQSLFKLRIENGMDSFTAINLVKRAMANGEAGAEFSKPSYWAPFVLNGR